MARKAAVLGVAPQLPSGSVDFNAFHNAIAAGASEAKAQAVAIIATSPVFTPTNGKELLDKEIK